MTAGLPNDSDDLVAFKSQLGIHASEDADFGWIAEVGLQSPLPPRWTSHTDPASGYVYYVDHDRQATSWENPLVPYLRRVIEIGRNYLKQPDENFFDDQKGRLWHQHKHELDCWHGPFTDNEGRQYFVKPGEGLSSWEDPRIDAQYIFELESGLLTSLEKVLPPAHPDTPLFGPTDNVPWRTAEGAEVLVIDGTSPSSSATPPRTASRQGKGGNIERIPTQILTSMAQHTAKKEHKSTLEKMSSTAERLQYLQQDEEEVQRLQFSRKVEARRKRNSSRSVTPTRDLSKSAALKEGLSRSTSPKRDGIVAPSQESHTPQVANPPIRKLPVPLNLVSPPDNSKPPEAGWQTPPETPVGDDGSIPPTQAWKADTDNFAPPSLPPSPYAGKKPVMPFEVERMFKESSSEKETVRRASFENIELKTNVSDEAAT